MDDTPSKSPGPRARVAVILPARNEEAALARLLPTIPDFVDAIVVVDNGSTDRTTQVAKACGASVVTETRVGYGAACAAGLEHVRRIGFERVVFMDADGSADPDEMTRLLAPIEAGEADLVLGARSGRDGMTRAQRLGTAFVAGLLAWGFRRAVSDLGPYRAARVAALDRLPLRDRGYGWTAEMQAQAYRAALSVSEVAVSWRPGWSPSQISGRWSGILRAALHLTGRSLREIAGARAGLRMQPQNEDGTASRPRAERRAKHLLGGALLVSLLLTGCLTPAGDPKRSTAPREGDESMSEFSHEAFDRFLRRHVDDEGRIDYARAAEDRADLDVYLGSLRATSPDSDPGHFPTEADRLAYWINAYNASVIDRVLARYPLASVIDVPGPWVARVLPEGAGFFLFEPIVLGGRTTRLYWLENTLIRRRFADPRIHFALNCASASCPRLPAEAFVPDRLEAQLARETARFLGEARNVTIDPDAGEVRLSAIFDWYTKDFRTPGAGRSKAATLRGYLAANLAPAAGARLAGCGECRVTFFEYDWGLNDQAAARQP